LQQRLHAAAAMPCGWLPAAPAAVTEVAPGFFPEDAGCRTASSGLDIPSHCCIVSAGCDDVLGRCADFGMCGERASTEVCATLRTSLAASGRRAGVTPNATSANAA